jgi:hypothetical protein
MCHASEQKPPDVWVASAATGDDANARTVVSTMQSVERSLDHGSNRLAIDVVSVRCGTAAVACSGAKNGYNRPMSAPILATKLYIPPRRPNVVLRSRLTERLNEGLH